MQRARFPSGEREVGAPLAQANRGRAVGRAQEGRVARAAALPGLAEHQACGPSCDKSAMRLQSNQDRSRSARSPGVSAARPIRFREWARSRPSVSYTSATVSAPVPRKEKPDAPGGRHGVQRAVAAHVGRREPDLRAVRRPREPDHARVERRQGRLLARAVDHGDRTAVVAADRVVQERDEVAPGTTRVADPAGRLVQDLAGRILELLVPATPGSGRFRRRAASRPTRRPSRSGAARRRPRRLPARACRRG